MIKAEGCQVWTTRGWMNAENLFVGDTIISYNPQRNCNEYDKISSIKMEYGSHHFIGIRYKSMHLIVTKDHPLIIFNKKKAESRRVMIDDVFTRSFVLNDAILYNRPLEPYKMNGNLDDILWSARLASSFSKLRNTPPKYKKQIWNVIQDISGYQAQEWIFMVLYWNTGFPAAHYMKSMPLYNRDLRAMIFHVGAKAGVGIKHWPSPNLRPGGYWLISASNTRDAEIMKHHWLQQRHIGHSFNITTKNGSFVARNNAGTFICPCDIKEI